MAAGPVCVFLQGGRHRYGKRFAFCFFDDTQGNTGVKILHIDTDDVENPLRGGQPVRTFQINSRLVPRHEVTVLTATYKNCLRSQERQGIQYRRLGLRIPGWGLSMHLSFLARLPAALKRHAHDLVVEEFMPPFGFRMLPRYTAAPVISMVQWFFFGDWERRYKLPFERMMRQRAASGLYQNFIVQSDRMGEHFREMLPQANIWKVPCGIGREAFHQSDSDGSYALFLGRLDINHKGLDFLLEAWTRLAQSGLRIPLKIVGAGPSESWLRETIMQRRLDDIVELVGRVEGAAKEELLRECRFLVMPSRQETFGLTALETMAASRPVLAFDIDHLNEVVKPAWGRLVPLGDVAALAEQASQLWQNVALSRFLGGRGYEEAQFYTWDALAEKQLDVYLDVVRRGSNR